MALRFILLLFLVGLLTGCAAKLQPYGGAGDKLLDDRSVWTLRIGRGNSQLFAGLLALNRKDGGLEAVLLDSTGIKLLAEKVSAEGEVEIVSILPAVKNRGLAPFLGEALYRLFLLDGGVASAVPCLRGGLITKCFGIDSDGRLVKFRRLGPWVLWSGDYSVIHGGSSPVLARARLNSGWLTPYLELERSGNYQSR